MIRTMQEFVQTFKAARRVSTPLVAVRTSDPASTIQTVVPALNGTALHWDIMHGLVVLIILTTPGATAPPKSDGYRYVLMPLRF
jgi:hypothetical protein